MKDLLRELNQAKVVSALAVLALLVLWESWAPFFPFQNGRARGTHFCRNLFLGVINGFLSTFLFVSLWLAASLWAVQHHFGLLNVWQAREWVRLIAAILLLDAWMYLWHWANHRLPYFWRFHRMHHSDPKMDASTASRFHFGEIALSGLFRIPVILLLGLQVWELVFYESMMFAVVQLHHANIGLPEGADRLLRLLLVSPAIHKVHHSREPHETNSNYSSLFSFWDRIFGTLRLRTDCRTIRYGLDGFDEPSRQSLLGLVKTPIAKQGDPVEITSARATQ